MVLGWFLIGGELANSLQVEQPGSNSYGEYTFMRGTSPWAGAVIGFFVGLAVVGFTVGAARLLRHCHREARTGVSTPKTLEPRLSAALRYQLKISGTASTVTTNRPPEDTA